jgi:hypothetical protein
MRRLDEHYRQYVTALLDFEAARLITLDRRLKQAMKEEYGAVASALNQRMQDLNSQIAHMSGSLQVCLSFSVLPATVPDTTSISRSKKQSHNVYQRKSEKSSRMWPPPLA